ncbi:type IV pilin protein [Cupriavidus sp. RAF12]|uniref:type IV pilin protein n=1 Tax=Cupriavidus sp. RAF12 TaxID=3233050 RepID=UPI003F90BF35
MTPRLSNRHRGFTLAEMMVTVAIIGILSAFAYPSYQEFILKGRRTEAKASLMENMQLFERHYSQVNTYFSAGTTTVWNGYKPYSGDNATSGKYTIRAVDCGNTGQCIELQAAPRSADATCGTLVYRSTGEKLAIISGTTPTTVPNCW